VDFAGISSPLTNISYIQHQTLHRSRYNPTADWYHWQSRRVGKDNLFKQNDKAYRRHVGNIPGLHELHCAEELHRFYELPVYYQDENDKVKLDPSIPPMGDPYHFHGSKWNGRKFHRMWQYWVQCYPSHASDIERELYQSHQEGREAWWNIKNRGRIIIHKATDKRSRPNDTEGYGNVEDIKPQTTMEPRGCHFERMYLKPPCQTCGSTEHPALAEKEDEYGDINYKHSCPMAYNENWETWYMRPCPLKIAAMCEYDEYQVLKLWHRICNDGWGQYQRPRILRLLLNMATKACKQEQEIVSDNNP